MTYETRRTVLLIISILAGVCAVLGIIGMVSGFLPTGGVILVIAFIVLLFFALRGWNRPKDE